MSIMLLSPYLTLVPIMGMRRFHFLKIYTFFQSMISKVIYVLNPFVFLRIRIISSITCIRICCSRIITKRITLYYFYVVQCTNTIILSFL